MSYTTPEAFKTAYDELFATYATGKTKSLKWRKWQLKQVWWMLDDNHDAFLDAMHKDLNRHPLESLAGDIAVLRREVLEHIKNLEAWTADEIPSAGVLFGTLGRARIRKEPLGVVLVVGAWNFPMLLLAAPVVAAIAAEISAHTAALFAELMPKYLDTTAIRVVLGGASETSKMLEYKFNSIFYTGSTRVGKLVAAAAAKHLTPLVLELGGLAPAIVTKTADLNIAAKRVATAKYINAGQICITVNHVFADPEIYDEFVERLHHWTKTLFNDDENMMVHVVNDRSFERLKGMLDKTKGKVTAAAKSNPKTRFFAPTVVTDVKVDDELFGPIAPVIKADLPTALAHINSNPHPLALYIFSQSQPEIEQILNGTTSGGVTINDAMLHHNVPNAPFGGVGDSGMGSYHGRYGLEAFTHKRTIVGLPAFLERFMGYRYAPYDIKDAPKVAVKNNLGFKKGETMDDQVIKGTGWFGGWLG